MTRDFDAIIVGSGPGGSTVADELTQAGMSVLVLERGRNRLINLENPHELAGDYSSDELKFLARHFLGADPWLEPRTFRRNETDGDRAYIGEVNNLPATVGGGGVHADGKLPRFREDDFRVFTELGPIEGASIADWPISYDDLEPCYADAERLIGVAGLAGANPFAAWRSGEYPMPPGAPMYGATITAAAAERIGLHPYPGPTGCNSVPYDGRPACNNCGFCAYFGCPIHAKGDPVAVLRRALLTGRAELRPDAFVSKKSWSVTDRPRVSNGSTPTVTPTKRALGTSWWRAGLWRRPACYYCRGWPTPRSAGTSCSICKLSSWGRCRSGCTATKAVRSPRCMTTTSSWTRRPKLRRMLMVCPGSKAAWSSTAARRTRSPKPKVTPGVPSIKSSCGVPRWRDRFLGFCMQGDDVPQATNRVDLDPAVRDVRGLPVARTTYQPHRHEIVASRYHGAKLTEALRVAGAEEIYFGTSPKTEGNLRTSHSEISMVPVSRHVVGTARMGSDPATSVCDPWGRLWEAPNVLIADSSLFPTGSGYGPTLTLVALALRNARALTGRLGQQSSSAPSASPPAGG